MFAFALQVVHTMKRLSMLYLNHNDRAKWSWPKVIMMVYADHDDNWWQPLQRVVADNWGSH